MNDEKDAYAKLDLAKQVEELRKVRGTEAETAFVKALTFRLTSEIRHLLCDNVPASEVMDTVIAARKYWEILFILDSREYELMHLLGDLITTEREAAQLQSKQNARKESGTI